MRLTVLVRSCALALFLLHLAMAVSLFVPSPGPAPENLWQELFTQDTGALFHSPAPAIVAGFLFLPLFLPPFAAFAASRSPVKMRSLIMLWSCLPLLLVGWFFWVLHGSSDDSPIFVPRWGFTLSLLLTLVEAIFLSRFLKSQEKARAVNQPKRLPSTQDEPARHPHPFEGETQSEHTGTARSLLTLVLLAILILLCYLLVFLSLFFPYIDTNGGLEAVAFQTTGWQFLGGWRGCTVIVLYVLLIAALLTRIPFKPVQKHPLLFRSIMLSHLLNLLSFLSSSLMLVYSLSFVGDLYGPFQSVDAAFGIPPAAFLLASICSSMLLGQVLEPRSRARPIEASDFPP